MMTGEGTSPAPAPAAEKPAVEKPKEKEKETVKKGGRGWITAAVIVILVLALALLTFGVTISAAPPAASYPYTTTYQVLFPRSQVVTIGNTEIIAIPHDNRVTLSLNKEPSEMGIGETKTIQERRASIHIFFLKVLEFDFRLDATYRGQSGDNTQFYLAFHTSQQVPSFLIERILPASVQARPV